MKVLELFAGTGSVGKVFKEQGHHEVVSLDISDEFHKPDIHIDILEWDYTTDENIYDFIWASPPCNSFSTMAFSVVKSRDYNTLEPLKPVAVMGDLLLNKTLEIIEYFQERNPHLKYIIENPRGMMRKMPILSHLYRVTTYYCMYEHPQQKPTDFFSNFPLDLYDTKHHKLHCCMLPKCDTLKKNNKIHTLIVKTNLKNRYYIPEKLIKTILSQVS
jgi:site-specific DNA-cytosine methylase